MLQIKVLARSQRHNTTQLDVLNNLLREHLVNANAQKSERGRIEGMLGSMRTTNSGLAAVAFIVGAGSLITLLATKAYWNAA